MMYKHLVTLLAIMLLSGCAAIAQVPDKTPCTGLIKTNGDCIGKPINATTRGA